MFTEGRWLREHLNVLLSGPTRVGKTFVACALANAACRLGFTARYYRVPRLVGDLAIARAEGSYTQLMARNAKTDLLVLDDWGLASLTVAEAHDLLAVVDDRCHSRSTVPASQLAIEDGHSALPNPSVADAILDRLVHIAHKPNLPGPSMGKVAGRAKTADRAEATL